jgi:hypothetical protein
MTKDPTAAVIENIQRLYGADEKAQKLFEVLAGRKKARKAMSIDQMAHTLGLSRGEAVAFSRVLESEGCGEFKMGRRGMKSRFIWAFNPISLGKAAVGEDDELEAIEEMDDLEDIDTEIEDEEIDLNVAAPNGAPYSAKVAVPTLTLSQAREAVAQSLGIPLSAVEITIKF